MKSLKKLASFLLLGNLLFANNLTNYKNLSLQQINQRIYKLKQKIKNSRNFVKFNNKNYVIKTVIIKNGHKTIKLDPMRIFNFVNALNTLSLNEYSNGIFDLNKLTKIINQKIKKGKLNLPPELKKFKNINLTFTFKLPDPEYIINKPTTLEGFKLTCAGNKGPYTLKNNKLEKYRIKIADRIYTIAGCYKPYELMKFYLVYKKIK